MSKIKLITILLITISVLSIYKIHAQETSDTLLDEENYDAQQVPQEQTKQDNLTGVITEIKDEGSQDVYGQQQYYQILNVKITSKIKKNEQVEIYSAYDREDSPYKYNVNDRVTILRIYNDSGVDQYYITDFQRSNYIVILIAIFLIGVLLLGRVLGLLSLTGLIYSGAILYYITIPRIINGGNPAIITFISALIIAPVIFYLSHGLKRKTTIALVGTLCSILLTILFSMFFTGIAKLTGSASKEALFLQYTMGGIFDIKGLLLGAIIIGSLSTLANITTTQTKIVEDLYQKDKKTKVFGIFLEAIKLSRNNFVNMLNIIILIFLAYSFPLFVLFAKSTIPAGILFNSEIVSEEILKTTITGISFVLAIPITTILSAILLIPTHNTSTKKKTVKSK